MMLVEINLLPQKEQKRLGFLICLIIFVGLFLLASILYYTQIHSAKNSIDSVSGQLKTAQRLTAQLQQKNGSSASSNSVTQLKNAIDWADKNRIETIPVMRHLTALLPERGFIQTFTYNETGTVTISVQFDTAAEAAGYLNSLNNSSWIDNASLTSLNTSDSNSSSASSSGSNSAAASSTANTSASSTADSNNPSENYVPRYIGQFEIQFNTESVKKAIANSNQADGDEQGGMGS